MPPNAAPSMRTVNTNTYQRSQIARPARTAGKSRTAFMRDAAHEKAREFLLDRTMFALDAAQFQRVTDMLDAPLAHSQKVAIVRLLARKAPWER